MSSLSLHFDIIFEKLATAAMPSSVKTTLYQFFTSYKQATALLQTAQPSVYSTMLNALFTYISLIEDTIQKNVPTFGQYHIAERTPFDFYQFGLDMVLPLIVQERSCVLGTTQYNDIVQSIHRGENVILLANHQAEIDPQIISLLIQKSSPHLAQNIVCVAGHRVVSDPLAIPFSRGRNLICIFSKKYIDTPIELRAEKRSHNAKAIGHLESLLHTGGVCLYVAPSGGRDRYSDTEELMPTPFDPQSVEMFRLLAMKSKKPTHIHLFALHTIDLLPPPKNSNIQLGEERIAKRAPAGLFFGENIEKIDIETQITSLQDKYEKRQKRADLLTHNLRKMYADLIAALQIK